MKYVLKVAVLAVILVSSVYGSTYNTYYGQASPIKAETPKVVLQEGTAGTSTIYANGTSAKVMVITKPLESTTFDHVLEVANQVSDAWKIRLRAYDQSGLARLYNCTIYFRDGAGVFRQICVFEGTYSQEVGGWYDLGGSSTVYIAMTVTARLRGTSHIYAFLEVLIPDTSTYNLMAIAFQITSR